MKENENFSKTAYFFFTMTAPCLKKVPVVEKSFEILEQGIFILVKEVYNRVPKN